ncbi:NAD(P)-dependent oxidoreductase [Agrilactobacillus yilanensis]|uniref:NAD(P)-dependent oxidoreductase n=1 Tax=Agrilactobacillus yilanensis TaxID=2485997 RepID=A0ABW4J8C1_9LACO|nr:NAD(P)H-binding protein [Agrilactobacillus yilanensis]
MLKVGIIGANGQAGALIAKAATVRNMAVTAIVRHPVEGDTTYPVIQKDLFALTQADIIDFDVLVCATAFWTEVEKFETSMTHLIDILQGTSVHLMVVGGAGSLYMDESRTTRLKDTKDFEPDYKPVADAMTKGLEKLKASTDVVWTYVSPAADFTPMGGLTSHYVINGDVFTTNEDGKSFLSYADYAQAFVTIMTDKKYLNRQISVHHVENITCL